MTIPSSTRQDTRQESIEAIDLPNGGHHSHGEEERLSKRPIIHTTNEELNEFVIIESSYVVKFVLASTPCLFASSKVTMNDSKSSSRKGDSISNTSFVVTRLVTFDARVLREKLSSRSDHFIDDNLFRWPLDRGEQLCTEK